MRISDWSSDVCSSDLDRLGSGRRGGAQWDTLMRNARQQAENYARRLPAEEGWPPFLAIVDVGHVIELFADFSLQGKHYAQFPDRQSFRSEEHTSELQSLMRISYAVFCLKKKKTKQQETAKQIETI